MSMEDIKALTENAECSWYYIDRLRMALASACKERDEMKKEWLCAKKSYVAGIDSLQKQLHEAKSELDAMRNELCCKCGNCREAHNGACDGCRWEERKQ